VALGLSATKVQQFLDNGVPGRSITVIITDGEATDGYSTPASDVKKVVESMLQSEKHIVLGLGIGGNKAVFEKAFTDMGLRSDCILTCGNTASDIRKAFAMVSQSVVRASQAAGSFSKTAGFGNP
jgi:hypothetical protein